MAVAHVNSASSGSTTADPRTLSFTCNSPANLLVSILVQAGAVNIVGVTYGATAMTLISDADLLVGPFGVHIAYLYSPTTGSAQTISWDLTAAGSSRVIAACFSGADTSFTPLGAESSGSAATATVDITPTVLGGVICAGFVHGADNAFTSFGSGQTTIQSNDEGTHQRATTYELTSALSLNAQTATAPASDSYVAAAAFFAPPGEPKGHGIAGLAGFGDVSMIYVESGFAVAGLVAGGESASEFAEAGRGIVGSVGRGISQLTTAGGGTTYNTTGHAVAGLVAAGVKTVTHVGATTVKTGFGKVGLTAASRNWKAVQAKGVSIGFGQPSLTDFPIWTRVDGGA